jgi:hypothetical protein
VFTLFRRLPIARLLFAPALVLALFGRLPLAGFPLAQALTLAAIFEDAFIFRAAILYDVVHGRGPGDVYIGHWFDNPFLGDI